MKKRIIVLANSIKKGGRCVAGVEILNEDYSHPELGTWIRPIDSTQEEGTLRAMTTYLDGQQIKPMDIIEIDCEGCKNDPHHPEDWVVNPNVNWRNLGHYDESILDHLHFSEQDAWGIGKAVAPGSQASTLQLIRTGETLTATSGYVVNNYDGRNQFKSFLTLNPERYPYEVSITDPLFSSRHDMEPRDIGQGNIKTVQLPIGTHLVMSITPVWEKTGKQYKVIASIIES